MQFLMVVFFDTVTLLKDLKEVDPAAFINVIKTDQVSGRFYIKPND